VTGGPALGWIREIVLDAPGPGHAFCLVIR
jgi:hypothetical protein